MGDLGREEELLGRRAGARGRVGLGRGEGESWRCEAKVERDDWLCWNSCSKESSKGSKNRTKNNKV